MLQEFFGRLFALVGFNNAYASSPPLDNYSMGGGEAMMGESFTNFAVTATIIRNPKAAPSTATEALYYYHNDHLGTPMMMTDEAGNVVWKREQMPYGETVLERGTITENLRFSGQYLDWEKNSSYNYKRDNYYPNLGRYGEPDPIGQEGGVNVCSAPHYMTVKSNYMSEVIPNSVSVNGGGNSQTTWEEYHGEGALASL